MRLTLNIPCLWQLGCIPRFDGYACRVVLPLCAFLAMCIYISFIIHNPRPDAAELSLTEAYTPKGAKKVVISTPGQGTNRSDLSLNYGIVLDCGSSGSRIYLYYWPPHSGEHDQLLHIQPVRDPNGTPYIMKIEPGISSFANKPSKAADYLRPLLDYVVEVIPAVKHHETPLYIQATAGMRLLTTQEQDKIVADIRSDIPSWYKLLFAETHVEVISGKQEAIYAWIAINYALGRFDHTDGVSDSEQLSLVELPGVDSATHVRKQTVGVLDLGGGSLQIAMEVTHSENIVKGLMSEFSLGCTQNDVEHKYRVYVSTFLNYGSNTARKLYEQTFFTNLTQLNTGANSSHGPPVVNDPCLPVGFREQISSGEPDRQMVTLVGTGVYQDCKKKLMLLINLSAPCPREPCSLNGVFQPAVDYHHSQFYAFSEFFYTMEDLLNMGGKYHYREFQAAARDYCAKEWSELEVWKEENRYPRADQNRYRLQCFKSAWMALILHEGLKFPKNYEHMTSVQYINNEEIHWTLGALLYKTRYYPLRELETHQILHYKPPWVLIDVHYANYAVIVCFMIVMAAILLYMRRLRRWQKDMRRVPTMSYFMMDEEQEEDGLNVKTYEADKSYYMKQYS